MNRLVIIGNGFDLAHGLPTSYSDFIDDFWKSLNYSLNKTLIFLKEDLTYNIKNVKDFESFSNEIKNSINIKSEDEEIQISNGKVFIYNSKLKKTEVYFEFKNSFFKNLNLKKLTNWVDIENDYYEVLKEIVKSNQPSYLESKEDRKRQLLLLNSEFEEVKILFEKYLKEKILEGFNFGNYEDSVQSKLKILNILKPVSFIEKSIEMDLFLNEFPYSHHNEIKNQFVYRGDELINDCNLTFLNFNYTPTLNNYTDILNNWGIKNKVIHIHGFINDKKNKINFGFGDEMDDDYKMIENINDNEYLKNFKSFQYLHTSNYKELLNLIDGDHFQVYLLGHSCGLSDRTLLNTIFEHQNCLSIKVFYHQWKDEDDEEIKDNYTEITQNISRHFNKKKLMREKIVNKTLCQPLPQIKLPIKE